MNLLKLSAVMISSVAILAMGATSASAGDKEIINTTATPLVKRGILLSVGTIESSTGDISRNLEAGGYANAQVSNTDDPDTFAVGYRHPLGAHWSVDTTYIDQDEISTNVRAAPSNSIDPARDVALSLPIYGNGINFAGLRHFQIRRGLNAHIGAGAFIFESEREAIVDGDRHVEKDRDIRAMAQLGLGFAITPRVNVELVGQRFFMSGEDVDRLSVGLSIGF